MLATGIKRCRAKPCNINWHNTSYLRVSKQLPTGIISISQPWQGWRESPTYGHPVSQEQGWEKKPQLLVPSVRLQLPDYKDETKRARKIPGHVWNQLVLVGCSCCCQTHSLNNIESLWAETDCGMSLLSNASPIISGRLPYLPKTQLEDLTGLFH